MTNGNLDFLPEDEGFKFVDDSSFLEVLDLLAFGLSSFNTKFQVPSDIPPGEGFLPSENFQTQRHLDTVSRWTGDHEMLKEYPRYMQKSKQEDDNPAKTERIWSKHKRHVDNLCTIH